MSTSLHAGDYDVAQRVTPVIDPIIGGLDVKWKNIGSAKPSSGIELDNAALAAALKNNTEFSMVEMIKLKVPTLSYEAFIQVGDSYFKPASLPPISERRKLVAQLFSQAQDFEEEESGKDQHPVFGPGSKIKSAEAFIDLPTDVERTLLSATLQKRVVAKVLCWKAGLRFFCDDTCAIKD